MKKRNEPGKGSFRFLTRWISLLIIGATLAGCRLLPPSSKTAENTITEDDLTTPSVEIIFDLQIPTSLSTGERVVLEVVDEVTGLPYNVRQYDLLPTNHGTYQVSLPFPTGSVIKYRYLKVGSTFTPEATISENEVRYRLLNVTGDENISDSVQSWLGDDLALETTGALSGILTDQSTEQPLGDILVSAAGNLTFTDANGMFVLDDITPGVQNIVFYAIDGKYNTFQQGATVVAGLNTPVNVSLVPRVPVQVTFRVTPPNDALGIPIYMAGNLAQLGNTFTNLAGGMSIDPKRLPLLNQQDDGTFSLTLSLYTGTDLRYKFTLGDGYWNAEQKADGGGFNVRQLIVPDHDVTIDLSIASWRIPGVSPVTFNIDVPPDMSPPDEKFIQLKTREWTSPLPLWPLGAGDDLYIVFSPLDSAIPLGYRFCRNEDCTSARSLAEDTLQPSESAQTVDLTLSEWVNWQPAALPTEVEAAVVPVKDPTYLTQIELTPDMSPFWRTYAPIYLSTLSEMGTNSVVFTPQWFFAPTNGLVFPVIGKTPFKYELIDLLNVSQTMGLSRGLFPQLGPTDQITAHWETAPHSSEWWQTWFESYHRFILNYARIAAETGTERLILGGKAVLPTFSGGMTPSGDASDVPNESDQMWIALIEDIRAVYNGQLVWATNAQVSADPLPDFIDQFDAIYVNVDAPLGSTSGAPTEDVIADAFGSLIDEQIYPIYQELELPITIGIGYPSVTTALEGCLMFDNACSNDGLFSPQEVNGFPIDLDMQVQIYNAVLPIATARDWVDGISIRGYNPTVDIMDGSSSIAGKPARDVIWYWFSGLRPSD